MKIYWLMCCLLFPLSALLHGQASNGMATLLAEVKEVKAQKNTYKQTIELDSAKSGRLMLSVEAVADNGKNEISRYDFNLADMDENAISDKSVKDLIEITLYARDRQDFIRHYKQDKPGVFVDNLTFYAVDADNVRRLRDALKGGIRAARVDNPLDKQITTYAEASRWFTEHGGIKERAAGVSYEQSWEFDPQYPCLLLFTQVKTTEKGAQTRTEYRLNAGDLDEYSIRFEAENNWLTLETRTKQRQKFISVVENGQKDAYRSNFLVYGTDIDDMRALQSVLRKLTSFSAAQYCNRQQPPTDPLEAIPRYVGKVEIGDKTWEQNWDDQGTVMFSTKNLLKGNPNGSKVQRFNLADFNDKSVAIEVSDKRVLVECVVLDKQKLVHVEEDGEQRTFVNKVEVIVNDIESAKRLQYLLGQAIVQAQKKGLCRPLPNLVGALPTIQEKDKQLEQHLAWSDGDSCKAKFTKVSTAGEKTTQTIYEFRLSDLDPDKAAFEVSGKELWLTLPLKFRAKYVKTWKDGKPSDYESEVSFRYGDVEHARCAMYAWKAKVAACAQ